MREFSLFQKCAVLCTALPGRKKSRTRGSGAIEGVRPTWGKCPRLPGSVLLLLLMGIGIF
jgi:hypothetical protein